MITWGRGPPPGRAVRVVDRPAGQGGRFAEDVAPRSANPQNARESPPLKVMPGIG